MLLESNNLPNTLIRFTNVPNVDTGDEVSENKDSVSLTESITFWQLSIAGTCLQVTDDNVSVFFSREDGVIYYTSPQSFIVMISYLWAYVLLGLLLNFNWLVHEDECPNVLTTN